MLSNNSSTEWSSKAVKGNLVISTQEVMRDNGEAGCPWLSLYTMHVTKQALKIM